MHQSERSCRNTGLDASVLNQKFYLLGVIISRNLCEEGMVLIASSEGVGVYCPKNWRCSFFNSPYPMHSSFAGVDIYPERPFGYVAPSPVKGEVVKVSARSGHFLSKLTAIPVRALWMLSDILQVFILLFSILSLGGSFGLLVCSWRI